MERFQSGVSSGKQPRLAVQISHGGVGTFNGVMGMLRLTAREAETIAVALNHCTNVPIRGWYVISQREATWQALQA